MKREDSRRHRDEGTDDITISKSAAKRADKAMQALGLQIAELRENEIRALDLPERLLRAMLEYKGLNSGEARRRQGQYIGKLMREQDPADMASRYATATATRNLDKHRFKEAERLRDQLIQEGLDHELREQRMQNVLERLVGVDADEFRNLVMASTHGDETARKSSARSLFRIINSCLGKPG